MIPKGTWVRVHRVLLTPGERADNLPEDTAKRPFEMWVKGTLTAPADIGDEVEITTATGRREHGTLETAEPSYHHDFGAYVPEIREIDRIVKDTLYGDGR